MKKVLFIIFALVVIIAVTPVITKAEITVRDYMSVDFLGKQGYSDAMIDIVEINKAKTFGEPFPPQWPSNPLYRWYRKGLAYIDPADDCNDFGYHQIKVRSTMWDY